MTPDPNPACIPAPSPYNLTTRGMTRSMARSNPPSAFAAGAFAKQARQSSAVT